MAAKGRATEFLNPKSVEQMVESATKGRERIEKSGRNQGVVTSVEQTFIAQKNDTAKHISPHDIEPSFQQDRFDPDEDAQADFDKFKQSIRDYGINYQPAIVRPHPEKNDKYQICFGHRRHRAIKELAAQGADGKTWLLLAFVRDVSDKELLRLQTSENAERRDLSYIEKAVWAKTLIDENHFQQKELCGPLSMSESALSHMLGVVRRIPEDIIRTIGQAHTVGEPRWKALSKLIAEDVVADLLRSKMATPEFLELSGKERMDRALEIARSVVEAQSQPKTKTKKSKPKTAPSLPPEKLLHNGRQICLVRSSKAGVQLTIPSENGSFGEWLKSQMSNLYEEFAANEAENGADVDKSMDLSTSD